MASGWIDLESRFVWSFSVRGRQDKHRELRVPRRRAKLSGARGSRGSSTGDVPRPQRVWRDTSAFLYSRIFSFQAEVSCKLLQAKLLHRNAARATTLAEVSVAGSASTDFVDRSGKLKKLAIRLSNPRITLTDGWPRTRTYMNYYFRSA